MKIRTSLDFQGNEIKLAAPEKVTALPDSNLFIGRTCILISEKESVGSIYYYNGKQWCHIEVEPLKIDETKINVIEDEITLHTFDTLSDAKTYIISNDKPKSVIIGSNANITSIGFKEFSSCTSITSITIPSGVTSIGDGAFFGCKSLTSITIPDSVTSIGNNAFRNCTSITSITMPYSVTSIGNNAFAGCTSLTFITMPTGVTSIGNDAFRDCTSLTSINIPSNRVSIGDYTFAGCTSLTSIDIPSTVTSIGNNAFSGCDILLLDNYKSRTGYPWGATDILIQNEDVTTTIDSNSTDRQVPTAKAVYDFTRPIFGIRYGFRIDKNNSDPDTRVEYLYDAIGMTPAKMTYDETTHKGTFDYGSWGNVWFIKNNRPVKLNFNGTVEAELNPNNYWETVDGQDSELETSTNCNFMSEIPVVYVKRWEDENYNYVVVCEKQYDEDYLAYANTDKDGNIKPIYAPIFKGYKDSNNILRSIAGVDPMNNTTTANEVTYTNAINTAGSVTGWQIEDLAKHELISDLLTLISKSTDSQSAFGNGVCQTNTRVFTGYNEIVTGTKTVKSDCGQFCGYDDNTHHVNVFHIQDFWGNRWDRCLGLVTSDSKYYYKMTPENGGYTITETISDYTDNGYSIAQDYNGNDIMPPSSNWSKNQSTGIFGNLPTVIGGSDSTYYCDYFYYNSSGVRLLILGGSCGHGRSCGSRSLDVNSAPSNAFVRLGASPFYV
jgi:hypothetical protein